MNLLQSVTRRVVVVGIAMTVFCGLSACSGGDDEASNKKTTSSPSPSAEPDDSTDDASDASESDGDKASWAKDITTPGEKLTTIKLKDVTVDVYQVDVTKAPKAGSVVDKETKKPIIDKGDDIVYLNYVVTNSGNPIQLGSSLVTVEPKYADWKYLGGMPSITDSALAEEMGINTTAIDDVQDPTVYPLEKGKSFSYGTNIKYQKGSDISFEAKYVPVDDEGELVHDKKVEGEAKSTIN